MFLKRGGVEETLIDCGAGDYGSFLCCAIATKVSLSSCDACQCSGAELYLQLMVDLLSFSTNVFLVVIFSGFGTLF